MDSTKDTSKCTWKLGDSLENSPHVHEPFRPQQKKIYDDVLDAIGNTPMVKINKLGPNEGINCELLAKCEFMNMGGSVKVSVYWCRIVSEREWFWTPRREESSNLEQSSLRPLQVTLVSALLLLQLSEDTAALSPYPKRCQLKRPMSSKVLAPLSFVLPPKQPTMLLNLTSEFLFRNVTKKAAYFSTSTATPRTPLVRPFYKLKLNRELEAVQ